MKASLAFTLASLLLAAWIAPARADRAKDHFRRGAKHYAAERYEEAAAEFQAAFEKSNAARSLFAWAQAERLSGDCETARELYQRLLSRPLSAEQEEKTRKAMARCEVAEPPPEAGQESGPGEGAAIAPEEAAPPNVGPQTTPPIAPIAAPGPRDGPAPGKSWIGPAALGAAGAVGVGLGVGLWVSARSEAQAAEDASDAQAFIDHKAAAESRQVLAGVSLGVGGALCGAAALWWFLQDDEPAAENLAVWADGQGGGVLVWGRF